MANEIKNVESAAAPKRPFFLRWGKENAYKVKTDHGATQEAVF